MHRWMKPLKELILCCVKYKLKYLITECFKNCKRHILNRCFEFNSKLLNGDINIYESSIDNTLTLTNVNKRRNMINMSTFKNVEIINI